MPYDLQIVVDSSDPHTLADWWAETLDWQVEPQDEAFIKDMVDKGFATGDETKMHNGKLVWRIGGAIVHPDGAGRSRILFQAVPEPKTVKNRVHVDVRVGDQDREAARDKLIARGAAFVKAGQQGPYSWFVMTDPEGNEFCLT
ncbi:hypothetical protein FB565_004312 [Actinoplanes lutulentus]|uniref:Glyoxalase-like domain-containing protein n=1 Tax=Actinoplanes lutulentus TaxID=1287878 RepID=A0A327YZI0_9ACTN|nr:VOC family protein [Actinoplanes lutulentus]MBB2944579.1 hypothetical protein [Actinoplanes lutulentus]RAK27213.1 hypothetical protein B0I29_124100 [Actinoplanes lutulentus]